MGKKACTINPVSHEDMEAQKVMAKHVGDWRSKYHSADYFGHALFSKKSTKNSIIEHKKTIVDLQDQLFSIKSNKSGDKARKKNIREAIKRLKSTIKTLEKDYGDMDKKNKVLQSIESSVFNQMAKYAESSLYDINPDLIFGVLRDWIQEQYTVPLRQGALHELDLETLQAIDNHLTRVYKKANKLAEKQELGSIRNTLYDPAYVMFEADPTGAGYNLIKKTRTIQDDMNAAINGYKRRFKSVQEELKGIIETEGIFYGGEPINKEEMTEEEKAQSVENLSEFIHEILDGESRYIKPTPLYADAEGKTLTPEFKADQAEYRRKLRDAIFSVVIDSERGQSGEHVQKWISPTGLQHYYIPIKHVQEDGSEVWNAYEVPWEEFNGRDSFLLPPRKASEREAWKAFFQRDNMAEAMEEGWQKSQVFEHISKMSKKGNKYTAHTHDKFIHSNRKDISLNTWGAVQSIRNLLREVREDVTDMIETQESEFNEIVKKLLDGDIPSNMSKEEIQDMVKSVDNLDGMNLNFTVKDGKVITSNHYFNELENYVPYMYAFSDSLLGLIKARDDMDAKIDSYKAEHKAAVANGNRLEAVKQDMLIKEANKMIPIFDDKINVALSLKDRNEVQTLNSNDLIKFTKSRAGFMNPIKVEKVTMEGSDIVREVVNNGRRKDFGVFIDYTDSIFRQAHHNSLKTETLNALQGTTKMNADYIFDHVKSSIGRLDVNAGLLGLDYSDTKAVKVLTAMQSRWKKFRGQDDYPPITPEMINNAAKIQGMWISGALLKWGSALTNNFQRISAIIEADLKSLTKAGNLLKNYPDQVKKVVELSGVTDTVVAMADSLMGAAGDLTTTSGLKASRNYWMLKIEKGRFIKAIVESSASGTKSALRSLHLSKDERDGAEWWADAIQNMIEGFDADKKIDAQVLTDVAEGIWLATNKLSAVVDDDGNIIRKSSLTKVQIKAMKSKLAHIMEKDQLNKYVAWSLGGGFASQLDQLSGIAFTKVEERMRTETFLMGAMMADDSGLIPQEWKDANADVIRTDPTFIYTHPEAQRFGRLLVYNTMFGLSPAYLPKAFKGAIGMTLFKFKPYQWHQMRNEHRLIRNWIDSRGEVSFGRHIANILTPGKKLSSIEEKFKSFMLMRGTISVLTVGFLYTPIVSDLVKAVKYRVMNSRVSSSMSRGGESAILSSVFKTMHMVLALGGLIGDDEEEEKIREEWYRVFLPLFVNVIIDTFTGEDPFKVLQLYSRSLHGISAFLKELAD